MLVKSAHVTRILVSNVMSSSVCEETWRPADVALSRSCPQEAARQRGKQVSQWLGDREELLKQLLDWALRGFKPVDPDRVPAEGAGESPSVRRFESDKPTSVTFN